ncbi:hypothetical protein F4861DRAFT_512453 [Xylaria intraflava]|nr:hypothetical protein F4861DRAFT_512453 [Xylaria intraflava]
MGLRRKPAKISKRFWQVVLDKVLSHPQAPQKTPEDFGAVTAQCQVTNFSSLPPELRQAIWDMSIDSLLDTPELLIYDPSKSIPLDDPAAAPTVYTAFPTAMHVNQEARYVARRRIRLVESPTATHVNQEAHHVARRRIRSVKSSTVPCMVPVRPFRPELDVLYIPWEAWMRLFTNKPPRCEEWFATVQHVAVDICISTNLVSFFRQVEHLPAVRTLRFVLASKDGHATSNSKLILRTPVARYVLRPFPAGRELLDDGDEAAGVGRRVLVYLDDVKSAALSVARLAEAYAPSVENHAAIRRLIDDEEQELKLSIGASVLMKYRHLQQKSSGFVEMGADNVVSYETWCGPPWEYRGVPPSCTY